MMPNIPFDEQWLPQPHGDNIYVNRLYSYQKWLLNIDDADLDISFAKHHQSILKRINQTLKSLDAPVRIVVAGGFNAGKSTFLNALLDAEFMPVNVIHSTAIVNCLVAGNDKKFIIYRLIGAPEPRNYENADHLRI